MGEMAATARTVLVVDDDSDIVELTCLVLGRGGYLARSAGSGREALESAQQEHPDLILLDINMPGMDGWQVLKILKIDERTRHIPVAMFSIKGEVRDKVRGLQDGQPPGRIANPCCAEVIAEKVPTRFIKGRKPGPVIPLLHRLPPGNL